MIKRRVKRERKRHSSAGFRRARERDCHTRTAGGARGTEIAEGKRKDTRREEEEEEEEVEAEAEEEEDGEGKERKKKERKKKRVIVVTPARLLSRLLVLVSELVSRQNYVREQASLAQLRLTAQTVHTACHESSFPLTYIYTRGLPDAIRLVPRSTDDAPDHSGPVSFNTYSLSTRRHREPVHLLPSV